MLFSELYSAYYNTVADILKAATSHRLRKNEIREIIGKKAFGESILSIEPAIKEERWQLVLPDGSTPIEHSPTMPLTALQKRWLKAIYSDPRVKLFTDEEPDFGDSEPLFKPEDIIVFDKYGDGDSFTDGKYIKNFRLILDAVKNEYPLSINMVNRSGAISHIVTLPYCLEYSEKDDKFRLIGYGKKCGSIINLARIVSCKPYKAPYEINKSNGVPARTQTVTFELVDERNALERALLHFAHFEKQAERLDGDKYRIVVNYNKDDETEIVIRVLSFGPMIKVISPTHFVDLIKERLLKQKSCGL